jgi:lactobin A/cerein 7B family class IIb bacteriocin
MTLEMTKANGLFEKRTVAELTEQEMLNVDGGATPAIIIGTIKASSTWCAAGAIFVAGAVVGYFDN